MKDLRFGKQCCTLTPTKLVFFTFFLLLTRASFGQGTRPVSSNLDLLLDGPFVVCEANDGVSLLVFTPDPKVGTTQHEDAGLATDLLDYRFDKNVPKYELKKDQNLHSGNMQVYNPANLNTIQFTVAACPVSHYKWVLKIPKPDEIYYSTPESIFLEPLDQCIAPAQGEKSKQYSTKFVLRYLGVDPSQDFAVSDGKNDTALKVLWIGSEALMVFEMPPIGEHQDHDKETYAQMAKIAGAKSCIWVDPTQVSHIWPKNHDNRNGHTDCHAPLIYLTGAK